MSETSRVLRVAIVGVGPRGLSVFERLCANESEFDHYDAIDVVLIDSTAVGSGAVWRRSQSTQLLMNTVASQVTIFTDSSVAMSGPVVAGPSLHEWAAYVTEFAVVEDLPPHVVSEARSVGPNTYPTRAFYGHYLRWAFEQIRARSRSRVRVVEVHATAVDLRDSADGRQEIELDSRTVLGALDAVVLTQGHLALVGSDDTRRTAARATALGLAYFRPGNAADAAVHGIPADAPVLIRGLGLTFFDYVALLTSGRGGRFEEEGPRLRYLRSGREPVVFAGSRRGVPHHARGENEKGSAGRHQALLLVPERIDHLRTRAKQFGNVDFRRDVWPLVAREVEVTYYSALVTDRLSPSELRWFRTLFLDAPTAAAAVEILGQYKVGSDERWDWTRITDPAYGLEFSDLDDYRSWLLGYLDEDARQARLGNVRGPVKAALDVLRDLRNEIRLIVDHGGISGRSYRDDLDRWYTPMNAFLSIGPPASRIAELAALVRAGVVRFVGPRLTIDIDGTIPAFVATSPVVDGATVRARFLIDARIQEPDVRNTGDPLLTGLLRTGAVRAYTLCDPDGTRHQTGGLDVDRATHAVIDSRGRVHQRRYAFGVPTESVRWVTAAGPRPGVNSVSLADADAIARSVLATDLIPTAVDASSERTPSMHDTGLLSPVRAGTPIERLVSDSAWIDAMVDVELALSRAQARLGMVPAQATQDIAKAVRTYTFDPRRLAVASRGAANPVVAFVAELTSAVAAIDEGSANYVHRGCTSQDVLDTATMVIAERAVGAIVADLDRVLDSLARLARAHRNTPVAGRTLAMHAVPTTFGAKVATWMHGIFDARDRLRAVELPVQLGGAAGTFASYVECASSADNESTGVIYTKLTDEFAAELGMAAPKAPWHTVRTPIADLASAIAITSGALGKFATDVISQSRNEIQEVLEPAADGRGESSAMPQKRNPVLSAMIRSAALQVPALTATVFGAMLAEDERPAGAWHAEWQPLRECLLLVGGAATTAAELAAGLSADTDRMRSNLELTGGQIVSERLAMRLTPLLGKTATKKTLQAAAFEAAQTHRLLADILAEDAGVRTHLDSDEIAELLRPENYLGATSELVDRALLRL